MTETMNPNRSLQQLGLPFNPEPVNRVSRFSLKLLLRTDGSRSAAVFAAQAIFGNLTRASVNWVNRHQTVGNE